MVDAPGRGELQRSDLQHGTHAPSASFLAILDIG